jgi:hypothetical protein
MSPTATFLVGRRQLINGNTDVQGQAESLARRAHLPHGIPLLLSDRRSRPRARHLASRCPRSESSMSPTATFLVGRRQPIYGNTEKRGKQLQGFAFRIQLYCLSRLSFRSIRKLARSINGQLRSQPCSHSDLSFGNEFCKGALLGITLVDRPVVVT